MAEENARQTSRLFSRLLVLLLAVSSAERPGRIFAMLEKKGTALDF